MSVHFKARRHHKLAPQAAAPQVTVTARSLLDPTNPLNGAFTAFLGGKPPTRRQGVNFLQRYPQLKGVAKAA